MHTAAAFMKGIVAVEPENEITLFKLGSRFSFLDGHYTRRVSALKTKQSDELTRLHD